MVFGRLLSLGDTGAVPERLARQVRVTNALALLGLILCALSTPFDALEAPLGVVVTDVAMMGFFASCWLFNARGRHTIARVVLMAAADLTILGGIIELGGIAELRTMFFPLVVLPFFVFSTKERGWLALFVAIPVIGYFATSAAPATPGLALTVYEWYAPVLALFMIIAGSAVFAWVHESSEENLAHTRARAAQAARLAALGEMSSGIAHEIRNPLAAIHIAASQLVDQPGDAAQVAQLGERIQRIVMRASRIIDGLRSFSRDASSDPMVATRVDRIVADTLELCGKRFAETGVTLTVDVPSELTVECRSTQLSQALMNLLSNAYDAAQAGAPGERTIHVTAELDGAQLVLAVSNSGPPIPAHVRARMFEPFFTTKSPDRGTGLGLSLSRGIVEAHHGTLELDERAPNTRFVVRLPVVQPAG